jgi:alkanesulfonate monooxygenase SsuD/methylene tetrahydromethanopterin reductase-like flavin-dependent oxidoreductase (luciferase family)
VSIADSVATDLVISPFGADAAEMVEVARCAEESGFGGVWTVDHFSGAMLGHGWSREAFTVLGAVAAVTERVRVGPLVANVVNRHPALLTSAIATLQSLSGGRGVLGLGSGAAPGSRFAQEHEAIGRVLGDAASRRDRLVETIEALRLLWDGRGDYDGRFVTLRSLEGVVGPEREVPVIVGAGGEATTRIACERADGVNLRVGPQTNELVALARSLTAGREFEISVHDFLDPEDPLGGPVEVWVEAGVDRRTLALGPPFDLDSIRGLGDRLNR